MFNETLFEPGSARGGFAAEERSRRANRRRLIVFVAVTVLTALIGLVYVYSRPAIYEATARLNFVPASPAAATTQRVDEQPRPAEASFSLRDETQFLTSRLLLARVWDGMKDSIARRPEVSEVDPALSLQALLSATQVEGTNIVLLRARGGDPTFLADFLDRLVAAYRASLADRYKSSSAGSIVDVRDEARKLEANVLAKRQEADAFRARYNIVSLERDENQVLAEVKGTSAALNLANDKAVAAEAKLGAIQQAQAAGQATTRSRDNPTLAALEQQVAGIRAELKEVAATFTPEYMQIDPRVRALRRRLAELEQQVVLQRQSSQQSALQDALEDVASSRAAATRLRQQLSANQQSVQSFTSRFNEYKALQDELARVEQLRQRAVERLAALEAQESTRMPKVEVVEAAAIPTSPASPPYSRDAAIAIAAAVLAGLATMGIVELFNRPPRTPAAVVVQQAWSPMPIGGQSPAALESGSRRGLIGADTGVTAAGAGPPAALPAPSPLPRELSTEELEVLLDSVPRALRVAIALLLTGLTRSEVVALRRGDVDFAAGSVHVGGSPGREVPVAPNVLALLPDDDEGRAADAPLLAARDGSPMGGEELDAALLYGAHDAGIDGPDEVTASSLHHTYVAFLVRQGVRFSELVELVGHLRPDTLAAYRQMAPAGARRSVGSVDRLMPVLRDWAPG